MFWHRGRSPRGWREQLPRWRPQVIVCGVTSKVHLFCRIQMSHNSNMQSRGSSRGSSGRLNVTLERNQDIFEKARMEERLWEQLHKYDSSKKESVNVKWFKKKNLEYINMETLLLLWIYRLWSSETASILTAGCWLSIMDRTRRNWQDTLWWHRGGSLLVTFNRNCKISCLVAKWRGGGLLFSSISLNDVHTEQIQSLDDDEDDGKHKDGTPLRNIRLENKIHKKMDEQLLQEPLKGQQSW